MADDLLAPHPDHYPGRDRRLGASALCLALRLHVCIQALPGLTTDRAQVETSPASRAFPAHARPAPQVELVALRDDLAILEAKGRVDDVVDSTPRWSICRWPPRSPARVRRQPSRRGRSGEVARATSGIRHMAGLLALQSETRIGERRIRRVTGPSPQRPPAKP